MGGYYEEKNFVYNDEHGNGSIFICGVRHRNRNGEIIRPQDWKQDYFQTGLKELEQMT